MQFKTTKIWKFEI